MEKGESCIKTGMNISYKDKRNDIMNRNKMSEGGDRYREYKIQREYG